MLSFPKFLYCHNELHNADEYILHTEKPRFLAKRIYHLKRRMFDIAWVDSPMDEEESISILLNDLKEWYGAYQDHLAKPNLNSLHDR